MGDELTGLQNALGKRGYASLTDFFLERPTFNFFTAAQALSAESQNWRPVDIGNVLRRECERRDDFHFFARVALFTALTGFRLKGWSKQHWLLFGQWSGLLGSEHREKAAISWNYLKEIGLSEGWLPVSIFDPTLEHAIRLGFG